MLLYTLYYTALYYVALRTSDVAINCCDSDLTLQKGFWPSDLQSLAIPPGPDCFTPSGPALQALPLQCIVANC